MNIKELDILGMKDAYEYLNLSYGRFFELVNKYKIPFKEVSCGRVFLKEDLDNFQIMRQKKYPHAFSSKNIKK